MGSTSRNRLGHAINEIFRAIGKVFYIIVRIILVVFGTGLVLAGFLTLLSFIMVFVFKYPGSFSADVQGFNIAYLPDFLNYIVSPAAAPWIKALIIAVVTLPLLALIYGGSGSYSGSGQGTGSYGLPDLYFGYYALPPYP